MTHFVQEMRILVDGIAAGKDKQVAREMAQHKKDQQHASHAHQGLFAYRGIHRGQHGIHARVSPCLSDGLSVAASGGAPYSMCS